MLANSDFCLLQEHWMYPERFLEVAKKEFKDIQCIVTSPMNENELTHGRPRGGTAILYNSKINAKVEKLDTGCNRLTAALITLNTINLLLITVYMPWDEQREGENLNEFLEVLDSIQSICLACETEYIILGGDFNCDIARDVPQTHALRDFIERENFYLAINNSNSSVTHTHESFSTIDHFILTPNLSDFVVKYEYFESVKNFSDHIPIMIEMNIDIEYLQTVKRSIPPTVSWELCTKEHIKSYQQGIDKQLDETELDFEVFACSDSQCKNHNDQIKMWYDKVVKILLDTSGKYLPMTGNKQKPKTIPGWNEFVKPKLETSLYWHNIWKDNGRPRHGAVADVMRHTRAQYHHAVKYAQREINSIRNARMAEAISQNKNRELWKEVISMTYARHDLPSIIDGEIGNKNIANIFFEKSKNLYNTVGFSDQSIKALKQKIETNLKGKCMSTNSKLNVVSATEKHLHNLSVNDLKTAIDDLKYDKKDETGLWTNHLKNGTSKLNIILTMLFNTMLRHGIAPDSLIKGTMQPIIKDKRGKLQDSGNYRTITIGTSILKLFEIVILNSQAFSFQTSNLQFGFKKNSSPVMCSMTAQEVISHYNNNKTKAFTVLLDASKAFDRVNYIKLFEKLLKRDMCPLVMRLLLQTYIDQKLCVKWNDTSSGYFGVTNGVRQGGILSPLLFSVYIDELLNKLQNSGFGCRIGHLYAGALGFADDLILICPTESGMQKMLKICESYAKEHDLVFNGAKSRLLIFNPQKMYERDPKLVLNGEFIPNVKTAVHLGNILHVSNNQECIDEGIRKFNRQANMFLSRFKLCSPSVRSKLFQQYCMSLYGCQLWPLWSNKLDTLKTKFSIALRRVWSLPARTHRDLLPLISGMQPLEIAIQARIMKFVKSLEESENEILKYIVNYSATSPSSILGRNIRILKFRMKKTYEEILDLSASNAKEILLKIWHEEIFDDYRARAGVIKELLLVKENLLVIDFGSDRIMDIISCDTIVNNLCVY